MNKVLATLLILVSTTVLIAQKIDERTFDIKSVHAFGTRASVISTLGEFTLGGRDENGVEMARTAGIGSSSGAFMQCSPCRKGDAFAPTFSTSTWITGGGAQTDNEIAQIGSVIIDAPEVRFPLQLPRGRSGPFYLQYPIRIVGPAKITDNRVNPSIVRTDPNVLMTGTITITFSAMWWTGFPQYQWEAYEIVASEP